VPIAALLIPPCPKPTTETLKKRPRLVSAGFASAEMFLYSRVQRLFSLLVKAMSSSPSLFTSIHFASPALDSVRHPVLTSVNVIVPAARLLRYSEVSPDAAVKKRSRSPSLS
jgi:hypothetical protein